MPVGFLACGPSGAMLLALGGAALGLLALTLSFMAGFICLFTSKRKLGIWLTSIPVVIFGLIYLLVSQQSHLGG